MERQKDRLLWIGGQYRQGTAGEFFDSLNPAAILAGARWPRRP